MPQFGVATTMADASSFILTRKILLIRKSAKQNKNSCFLLFSNRDRIHNNRVLNDRMP